MFHIAILDDRSPAFVGPELARQIESEIYFTIGATAVLLWDIILHIPEDYKQIRKQGLLKLSRIVYCFSRFITLFYMVALCVLKTAPIGNCAWMRYVAYISPCVVPGTILLFLFRIYALFPKRTCVLVFVFLSWLTVVGTSIAVAVLTEGVNININGTKSCMKKIREKDIQGALSAITRFSHDTLVFVMTSWWLYKSDLANGPAPWSGWSGRHLLPLSRSFLHDGQAYYLTTLILNIFVIVLPLITNPFVTPCTLGILLVVLIHNMTCHVYRNLVSAKYRDHGEFLQYVDGRWRKDITEMELSTRPGANA